MFEIELFICIKMNLALITYNGWCDIKPNQTKHTDTHTKVKKKKKETKEDWLQQQVTARTISKTTKFTKTKIEKKQLYWFSGWKAGENAHKRNKTCLKKEEISRGKLNLF